MNTVLIIGNITKDVYLNLSPAKIPSEIDENNYKHVDLVFSNTPTPCHKLPDSNDPRLNNINYSSRASFYGGSAIIAEVLSNFNQTPVLSNATFDPKSGDFTPKTTDLDYRYILTLDGDISYLSPDTRTHSIWRVPTTPPDWIFIDFSANLTSETTSSILGFLNLSTNTKLAACIDHDASPALQKLAKSADLIFTNNPDFHSSARIYRFCNQVISNGSCQTSFIQPRINVITHLSLKNLIASTIFAALLAGKTEKDAINLAKINIEKSTIGRSLNMSELDNLLKLEQKKANPRIIAKALMLAGKGILAADESGGSIHKKFAQLNIPDTYENRRQYRNIFFTTPHLSDFVNGVILFDETARQTADNGKPFTDFLISQKIIPGIKVDEGLADIPSTTEKYTKGLENLALRLDEYYKMGLRFAKWRAAFEVSTDEQGNILTPSAFAITKNTKILADYAKKCQSAHIVPIVEPELVHDGNYSLETCANLTEKILISLFTELEKANVDLEGCILKINMILAGKKHHTKSTPVEVGRATADLLKKVVPKSLAGVVFLSGGQTPDQATNNLTEIIKNGPFPWPVTFSFARALQDPALFAWQGTTKNIPAAASAFKARLIANKIALDPSLVNAKTAKKE